MLQLTKRTEYGLIALLHMADREGHVVSVREIAESYPVPRRLMAEVLKDLGRARLVESQRGATGGYVLSRSADAITLGDVVAALEGAPSVSNCDFPEPAHGGDHGGAHGGAHAGAHSGPCDVEPVCPIRSPLHRIREGIWRLMERTTLRSLAQPAQLVHLDLPRAAPRNLS